MIRVLLVAVSILFGVLRLAFFQSFKAVEIPWLFGFTCGDVFKDLAHLYVGGLYATAITLFMAWSSLMGLVTLFAGYREHLLVVTKIELMAEDMLMASASILGMAVTLTVLEGVAFFSQRGG